MGSETECQLRIDDLRIQLRLLFTGQLLRTLTHGKLGSLGVSGLRHCRLPALLDLRLVYGHVINNLPYPRADSSGCRGPSGLVILVSLVTLIAMKLRVPQTRWFATVMLAYRVPDLNNVFNRISKDFSAQRSNGNGSRNLQKVREVVV